MSSVLIKKEKFYYSVKLNRPEKHNAFNPEMIQALTEFFKTASKDKFARAVLLTGAGSSFCAGADLEWMKSMAQIKMKENLADAKALDAMFAAAHDCELPIIGYLQGSVFGGGVGLAAICDIAVAEAATKFCFSEVKLGLVPAVISRYVLKKMQVNKAREWMLTGRVFDASEAKAAGLVECAGRELEAQAYLHETLKMIGQAGPEALRECKKLVGQVCSLPDEEIQEVTTQLIAQRRVSDEGQEGLKAFIEKRKPGWVFHEPQDEDEE